MSGKVTEDQGGKTRFGISQRANPDLTDENFYALPLEEALAKAREIYVTRYVVPIDALRVNDQRVANKMTDMFVNMGVKGIEIFQAAAGAKGDGIVGPKTLRALQSGLPAGLVTRMARLSIAHYDELKGTKDDHESWDRRGRCLGKVGDNLIV